MFSRAAVAAAFLNAQISPLKILFKLYLNHFCRLRRHVFWLTTLAACPVKTKPVSWIQSFLGSAFALTKAYPSREASVAYIIPADRSVRSACKKEVSAHTVPNSLLTSLSKCIVSFGSRVPESKPRRTRVNSRYATISILKNRLCKGNIQAHFPIILSNSQTLTRVRVAKYAISWANLSGGLIYARIGRSGLTRKLEKVGPFECDELEKHCRVSAKC